DPPVSQAPGGDRGEAAREGSPPRARRASRDRARDPRLRAPPRRHRGGRDRRDRAAPGDLRRSRRMKCRKCGDAAALELRRHNAAFCSPHFLEFFQKQVREAIRHHRMFAPDTTILVAVSGGQDSLALWGVLRAEGDETAGLYLDLGISEYSVESKAKCAAFAAARGQKLIVERVVDAVGAPIPEVQKVTRRPTCSACGLSKRYLMNRAALEH